MMEAENKERERDLMMLPAGFKDGGRDHGQGRLQPLEDGKGKEVDCSSEPPGGIQPC